jgi:hypothetical protein
MDEGEEASTTLTQPLQGLGRENPRAILSGRSTPVGFLIEWAANKDPRLAARSSSCPFRRLPLVNARTVG